jgi:AmmeMemoRadiSam system protein A
MSLLTPEESAELLAIAEEALRWRVVCNQRYRPEPLHPALRENRGAFVTLRRKGELRGCLGRLSAAAPLYLTVCDCAGAAACDDCRFEPVSSAELAEIDVWVSVLAPLQVVNDPEEIEVGKHGLFIEKDGLAGVLLPQVAEELGLDRERLLQATCRKAGLDQDAWKRGALIRSFTAQVIRSGLL